MADITHAVIDIIRQDAQRSGQPLLGIAEDLVGIQLIEKDKYMSLGEILSKQTKEYESMQLELANVNFYREHLEVQLAEMRTANTLLKEETRTITRQTSKAMEQINELNARAAEIERQKDIKLPDELLHIEDLIRAVIPDRRCHATGCNGRRGWSGFSVTIDKDGKRHVTLNLCCGKIGQTEFTVLATKLDQMERSNRRLLMAVEESGSLFLRHTLAGQVRRLWEMKVKPALGKLRRKSNVSPVGQS